MDTTFPGHDVHLRLAVIIGSTREGRFGPTVADWFAGQARQREDLDVDVIDLADAGLPAVLSDPAPAVVTDLTPRLAEADAIVIVTPEYNHSYPASLKAFVDWYYDEWKAKPVGFVSYGGIGGGLRSVEHLRGVFAELHATTVRDVVSFHDCWNKFDDTGQASDPDAARAAKGMLDQLGWWGRLLRFGRAQSPYGQ
ncbi:NADPH-dependent FMN reductase [Nocardia gipuzkoensis]